METVENLEMPMRTRIFQKMQEEKRLKSCLLSVEKFVENYSIQARRRPI